MGLSKEQIENLCRKRPVRPGEGGSIMTGPVRLSFPSLHKKTAAAANATPKYSTLATFPHANVGPLHAALTALLKASYPGTDPNLFLDPFNNNHPLKDQALRVSVKEGGKNLLGKTTAGFVPGLPFINPKSGQSVPCFHSVGGQWKQAMPEEIEALFPSGCWVDMKIGMGKSTAASNPGASLYLNGVYKLADDDRLGGGGPSASAEDGGSADDAVAIEDPNGALGASGGGWGAKPTEQAPWE